MNKATLLCFVLVLVGEICAQSIFPIAADVPFSQHIDGAQTIYFRVAAPADSNTFTFTVIPCSGHVAWWVGPQGEIVSSKSSRKLYYYDTNPTIHAATDANSVQVTTSTNFTITNYQPGYYYVGVINKNTSNISNVANINGFFGVQSPYPDVGGGNAQLSLNVLTNSTARLSWMPSSSENVQYCIYVQDYYSNSSVVHGSGCGLTSATPLACTSVTSFLISNLHPLGIYYFDVTVSYIESHPNSLVSSYNSLLGYIVVENSSSTIAAFGFATLFALLVALF